MSAVVSENDAPAEDYPANRPNFSAFLTMVVAVIIIFALISQIGKFSLPFTLSSKNPAPRPAENHNPVQDKLLAQRARAMVTIGALPKEFSRPAPATLVARPAEKTLNPAPQNIRPAETVAIASVAATTAPVRPAANRKPLDGKISPVSAPGNATFDANSLSASNSDNLSTPAGRYYRVRPGDTLFAIARKAYGDGAAWKRILRANHLGSPAAITVGQKLLIPGNELRTACARR